MKTAKMKGSQVNELVVSSKNLALFHDQYREGFVFLDHETIPLRSKKMRLYLTKRVWDAHQKCPSAGALNQAIDLLKAMAIFNNPQVFLCNRVGKGVQGDDSFYYDLGKGKAIRTTPQGWAVCDAPILFRRYDHQKEQVTPIQGGDQWALFEFINVEPEYRLLLLDYLISCLVPNISHPVIHPHGDHGAGKTTACVLIRDLIDPSSLMAQSIPRDFKELIQVLAHHYFPVFDNVSSLPGWISDVFSQACTGGGLSKRKLYTDDEDIIYSFKRPIALNAINVVVHKPDLMDRSILFPLERIHAERRKRERELWGEFENLKPSILGGMFDTLSKAMTIYPMVQLPWTPRMADFGAWGFAIAEALEIGAGEKFLQAYQRNIERQIEEVIQINALAQAVLSFMENQEHWQGTIGDAWKSLYKIAGPQKDPSFPKNERALRRHLATIRTILQHNSIFYQIYPRSKNGYPIIFTRNPAKFDSFGSPSEFPNKISQLGGERTGEANKKGDFFGSPSDSSSIKN
ncbi:MAG: hypothetical protein ABSH06_15300 [Thermodesulfobacteriota bacterium]